ARGTGKSSLVKAVQQHVFVQHQRPVVLVDIHREDIGTLPQLLSIIRKTHTRVIIFCDDLSFSKGDSSYKSLKAVLEGGVEGRPDNAVFYATSNRRHLLSREMIENEQSTAIMPGEAVEENVSLSDRFGLWLGFHHLDQATYLSIVEKYAAHVGVMLPAEQLHAEALEWSATRGARSGRVAWQFITDLQSKTLVDQH
ncbi:MAG: ATP-binding protein, partial [Alphaproteobacteria bacterium]|nr:ATP-binding protein [Alphaproteobacteria bacterium]